MSLSLDNNEFLDNVTITSKDGQVFDVPRSVCKWSAMLEAALQSGDTAVAVNVEGKVLANCLEWMTLLDGGHKPRIDKPLTSIRGIEGSADDVTIKFLLRVADCADETSTKDSKNKQEVYDLVNSANYLMIDTLFAACCAFIASMVKAAPRDQVESILKP